MNEYAVRFQAGPYEGVIHVWADDEEHAIAIAKAKVHRQMSLPMYYEHYEIERKN